MYVLHDVYVSFVAISVTGEVEPGQDYGPGVT